MKKFEFSDGQMYICESQTAMLRWYGFQLKKKHRERDVKINKDVFVKKSDGFEYTCSEFNENEGFFKMEKLTRKQTKWEK